MPRANPAVLRGGEELVSVSQPLLMPVIKAKVNIAVRELSELEEERSNTWHHGLPRRTASATRPACAFAQRGPARRRLRRRGGPRRTATTAFVAWAGNDDENAKPARSRACASSGRQSARATLRSMGGRLHALWSLFGTAALCVGAAGCAADHDDSLRLSEELARTRADAAWQQARAAELESRISRLEQRAGEASSARSAEERLLWSRIDRLLELNETLLDPASRGTTAPR